MSNPPTKYPLLVLLPPALLAVILWQEVLPWFAHRFAVAGSPPALWLVSAVLWAGILWWALHHLTFQLAGLCPQRANPPPAPPTEPVRFVVLYLTRDDFQPECALSCVAQDYPSAAFRVAVCDDSETEEAGQEVDDFCKKHNVERARRPLRTGFKAGNLNNAFRTVAEGHCDWIVIVDADQRLPRDYLQKLGSYVAAQPPEVAFVQAGRDPPSSPGVGEGDVPSDPAATPFQEALQMEGRIFFERDMGCRRAFGFLPFLGHGGAVRESAWKELGGFPVVVSEDYAFTMVARHQGFWGERVDLLRSWDGYPRDFGAFVVRVCKFARGAAELLTRWLPWFLCSRATWVEKADAGMLLATYLLMPLFLGNLLLSAYLCHLLWGESVFVLPPRLPYLFLAMFLLSLSVLLSVHLVRGHAVRQWFWAFAVYGAALPVAAGHFLLALFRRPSFVRTPKGGGKSPRFLLASAVVCALGAGGLGLAWLWWSPFSPILAAFAAAQASFPLYRWLHEDSALGRVTQLLVYLPGVCFLAGLAWMWHWGVGP